MKKWLWLISVLLSACFRPSGEYYNSSVQPKDFSGVSINLNNASDTIYLYQNTQLTYSAVTSSYPVVQIKATLNDQVVYSSSVLTQGSFLIFPPGTGTFQLKIILIVDSGTGSLLDKLGGEQVEVWRSFVVVFDLNPPPAPNVKLDTTGGIMKVRWDAYSKRNFSNYMVTKTWNDVNGTSNTVTATINSISQTSWIDSTYVGGPVQYIVSVTASNRSSGGIVTPFQWFPREKLVVKNNSATLQWKRNPFYKNAKGLTLVVENQPGIILNVTDSSYQISGPVSMGHAYNWAVTYTSKISSSNYQYTSTYYRGVQFPTPLVPQFFDPKDDLYFGYGGNYDYAEMDTSLHFKGYITAGPTTSISPDGNYVITYHQADGINGTFYQVSPNAFQLGTGQAAPAVILSLNVANNGLIEMSSYSFIRVYSWPALQNVYSNDLPTSTLTSISPSGNYLFDNNNLYHYAGSSFRLIGPVNSSNLANVTFTDTDNLILAYEDGTVVILNSSLNVISTWTTPALYALVLTYDPVSKRILVGSNVSGFYILNPVNGNSQFVSSGAPHLLNGKIFCVDDTNSNYIYELNYDQL